ncbi:hypothetical protein BC941DRAFT_416397 [Chlamydoabsidia padenii]|nr:hypothetical protein BC941DRAFT_416397 [Chlamydoabsidia padenii]
MADDLVSLVQTAATAASELQQLIESSRKKFDLPPYVNPDEYEVWKQEKVNNTSEQKVLRDKYLNLERTHIGRERYLERLSTYSAPFIASTTPVSPDQCAMHGWIDTKECHTISGTKVFQLSCQQCSTVLDVPDLTGINPDFASVKRIYSSYPKLLNNSHSEVCFWRTASCHVSVCAFPLVTTSDAFDLLEKQGTLLKQWDMELPLVKTDYDQSKMRMLQRIIKSIEEIDVFAFPQHQVTLMQQTAYLLPMFGWHFMNEQNSRLLKCACCFRHVLIPNYLQINDLPPSYVTNFDNKSFSLSHIQSSRQECIKGAFDPVNEHRPYCPWRNRDTARINIKDSFFVPPKQPLNGCEWILEIICKEWFRLTTEDEKHPRHDEFRRAAERHLTTSIAQNHWMTEDLTKYALSKSRLKRGLLETDDRLYAQEGSVNKKEKLQHEVSVEEEPAPQPTKSELAHPEDIENNDKISSEKSSQPQQNQSALPISESTSQVPQHIALDPETTSAETSIDRSLGTTTEETDMEIVEDTITDQVTSNQLDDKEDDLAISPSTPAASNQVLESEKEAVQHIQDNDVDEQVDLVVQLDKTVTATTEAYEIKIDNLVPAVSSTLGIDDSSKTVTIADDLTVIPNSDNVVATNTNFDDHDKYVITDLNESTTNLDDELNQTENEESLQQEDFGLTPNGDGVSTNGNWSLVDTDNAATSLEDDTKTDDEILASAETVEGESRDIQQNQFEEQEQQNSQEESTTTTMHQQQSQNLDDIRQDQTGDLDMVTSDGNEGNVDVPTNDADLLYDQHEETELTEMDTTDTVHQHLPDDTAAHDELDHEQELQHSTETPTSHPDDTAIETLDSMEIHQNEYERNKAEEGDVSDADLDEFDHMAPLDNEETTTVTMDENQTSELENGPETDIQSNNTSTPLDTKENNPATPQELDNDHIMTPVDLDSEHVATPLDMIDDNASYNTNNGGTASQDITDKTDHPPGHFPIAQGLYHDEVDEDALITQDMEDSSSSIPLRQTDDDIGANSADLSGQLQSNVEGDNGEENKLQMDLDIINNNNITNDNITSPPPQDGRIGMPEPSDLNDNSTDASTGLVSTPIILEQEHTGVEEGQVEELDEHQATGENRDDLQFSDDKKDLDSKPSCVDPENTYENDMAIDEQLQKGIDTDKSQEVLAQEPAAPMTAEDDTNILQEYTTEIDGDDKDIGDQLEHNDNSNNDGDGVDDENDDDGNDGSLEQKDLDDSTVLNHDDGMEEHEEHGAPDLNDTTGENGDGDDSLDQQVTESANDTLTAGNDLIEGNSDDLDTHKLNNAGQLTTEHTFSVGSETAATENPALTTPVTELPLSPTLSAQQEGPDDLDHEISIAPVADDDDIYNDTRRNDRAVEQPDSHLVDDTTATSETTKENTTAIDLTSQVPNEQENITQNNTEDTTPTSPPLTESLEASANTTILHQQVESNNEDEGQIQVEDDEALVMDGYDMEETPDDDDGNTTIDHLPITPVQQQPVTNDYDMLDQHDEEDQLMQYEDEDNNKDDESMIEQDDLMEE